MNGVRGWAVLVAAVGCGLVACDDGGGGGDDEMDVGQPGPPMDTPDVFGGMLPADAGPMTPDAAPPQMETPCDPAAPPPPDPCATDATGLCTPGTIACCTEADAISGACVVNTTWCVGDVLPGTLSEACDDGRRDEDCDGLIDEDFTWTDPGSGTALGVGEPCSVGLPGCVMAGSVICDADGVAICSAEAAPTGEEICDGADNDCDGAIDEDFDVGEPCAEGLGVCAATGVYACGPDGGLICRADQPGQPAADELCDGLDNDCDGATDENFPDRGIGEPCLVGLGGCTAEGVQVCTADGASITCDAEPLAPTLEQCGNQVDDDCDGIIDEGFESFGAPCEVGVGVCRREGEIICDPNAPTRLRCSVQVGAPTSDIDRCDGGDEDCDGLVDEDFEVELVVCGGENQCVAATRTRCADGVPGDACREGGPIGGDATCDGVDDDCDGLVDESFARQPVTCGIGACQRDGERLCLSGLDQIDCAPGFPRANDRTCDGVDDDCDGLVDEDYVSEPTECGRGACARRGGTICDGGRIESTCSPGEPTADDNCNGRDDNCDGHTDEDFAAEAIECAPGSCAPTSVPICVAGEVHDTCRQGAVISPLDGTCDGVDDDCDGAVDENVAPGPSICGTGACRAEGTARCIGGAVSDNCVAGEPGIDDVCDGIDQNCDGAIDEGWRPQPFTCGTGACANTVMTRCDAGVITAECQPAEPGVDDTCDGVDDDCDGVTDEAWRRESRECDEGSCREMSFTVCTPDGPTITCRVGPVTPVDRTCDGFDDDCDGVADEDAQGQPVRCGFGPCAAQGTRRCIAGEWQDQCIPGQGQPADVTCDGTDDDCDGVIDEDGACP